MKYTKNYHIRKFLNLLVKISKISIDNIQSYPHHYSESNATSVSANLLKESIPYVMDPTIKLRNHQLRVIKAFLAEKIPNGRSIKKP